MRLCVAIFISLASIVSFAQEVSVAPRLLSAEELPVEVDSEALQRQYSALSQMRVDSVSYSILGPVKRLVGDTGLLLPLSATDLKAGDTASNLVSLFQDLLLAKGDESLKVISHDEVGFHADPSTRVLKMSQEIGGIPVINSFVGVNYDDKSREVSKLNAAFLPNRGLDRVPKIPSTSAEKLLSEALSQIKGGDDGDFEILDGTYLAYLYDGSDPTPPRLVWVVRAQHANAKQWAYYVNAISGALIDRVPLSTSLTRKVYDANGAPWTIPQQVPSTSMTLTQINASPHGAREAYDHVLVADTKLRLRFLLPPLRFPTQTRQIIRYPFSYPEAEHLISGSNDYILYSALTPITNSSTTPPDITYHEYGHGIGKRTFPLLVDSFDDESGAMHEGFADIAAATVDIAVRGAPATASWRIAEGWFTFAPSAVVRSMIDPADAHASYGPREDWFPSRAMGPGFVHYNATILTHAYYLSIHGGLNAQWLKPEIPEITVPPLNPVPLLSEDYARRIFVTAFNENDVFEDPTFLTVKQTAMNTANLVYGPLAQTSIKKAFEAVGVGYQCSNEPTAAPAFTLLDFQCNGTFKVSWPTMPGVNRYIAQIAPQALGWGFGIVAADGDITQCFPQINQPSIIRMRACNNCGCGPWSGQQYMNWWNGPCN